MHLHSQRYLWVGLYVIGSAEEEKRVSPKWPTEEATIGQCKAILKSA